MNCKIKKKVLVNRCNFELTKDKSYKRFCIEQTIRIAFGWLIQISWQTFLLPLNSHSINF